MINKLVVEGLFEIVEQVYIGLCQVAGGIFADRRRAYGGNCSLSGYFTKQHFFCSKVVQITVALLSLGFDLLDVAILSARAT